MVKGADKGGKEKPLADSIRQLGNVLNLFRNEKRGPENIELSS